MKKWLALFFILIFAVSLTACSKKDKKSSSQSKYTIVTVKKQSSEKDLPYSGTIKPLTMTVVTSPNSGLVVKKEFNYGEIVKKKQLLFVLNSSKFQQNFSSVLTKYITAKNTFIESKSKLQNQTSLYKDGLIPREQYTGSQDTYYNSYISLLQAKDALIALLEKHKNIKIDINSLNLRDVDQLTKLFGGDRKEQIIKVYSPDKGVALLPDSNTTNSSSDGSGSSASGPISLGSSVKQGQNILSVGNLSGVTINVNINEVNINQVKKGLAAVVTGIAFPGVQLKGSVTTVGSQAKAGNSGIPTFPVTVTVPSLTAAQQKVIRVGMSAKVTIIIKFPPQIKLPISAVKTNSKGSFVEVRQSDGSLKSVQVQTGQTGLQDVVILKGLKSGDKVAVPN